MAWVFYLRFFPWGVSLPHVPLNFAFVLVNIHYSYFVIISNHQVIGMIVISQFVLYCSECRSPINNYPQ